MKKTFLFIATAVLFSWPCLIWAISYETNTNQTAEGPAPTSEQQTQNAVQPVMSPTFAMANSCINSSMSAITSRASEIRKGLQFKNPVLSPGVTYRSVNDSSPGGFGGNEFGGDISLDADVYDGLVMGVLYQHVYRGASNSTGTSEHLDSNGVSLYSAKRFYDLLNVGLSYNYANSYHRLSRAVTSNLDRDSHGFTMFAGLSDKKGKWSWSLTPSFGYVRDLYDQQKDLDTGRVSVDGSLGYDITKYVSLTAVFGYHNFPIQDTFPDTTIRDDDYWNIGPRLQFYPTDTLTVTLDFDSQEGYKDYKAYTLRVGVGIAF